MSPKELSKLERWQVEALYWSAEQCASDLSRGCAGLQDTRDKLLAENARMRAALIAWRHADWCEDDEGAEIPIEVHEARRLTDAALEVLTP